MAQLDSPSTELALELQQVRPDRQLIDWLVKDQGADVRGALARANLKKEDLLRRPALRPLGLQRYL